MNRVELTYDELAITPSELYEQMGYGQSIPDEATLQEIDKVLQEVKSFLKPSFCYFVKYGALDLEQYTLTIEDTTLSVGKIIARQLRGAEAYAFFVCTAGMNFEDYQRELMRKGDMVRVFIADALGSVIAEKAADRMEESLQMNIDKLGWKHTNRFSPGYCSWHVSQQQLLFPLFGTPEPCGVHLSDSSLMTPIKSVSGVIGVGPNVRHLDYTCGLCVFDKCFKKRR
ncbi:MAG: methionine synthase [Prevotella sp.]|nr:methionine synthase [Prevotella sp.]